MNHNQTMLYQAQYRAKEMKTWPSPLEEKMKVFLGSHNIRYEAQKIFYIYKGNDIIRYYIADFFLPNTNTIVEVDGKFHENHKQKDRDRTKDIQVHYPDIEVLRFNGKDMKDPIKMEKLIQLAGGI